MKAQDIVDRCGLHVDRIGRLYIRHLDKKGRLNGIKQLTHSEIDSESLLMELLSYVKHVGDDNFDIRQAQLRRILDDEIL